MAKTRPWSRTGSVIVAVAFVACGRAERDGDGTNSGGDGGRTSVGGKTADSGGAGPSIGGTGEPGGRGASTGSGASATTTGGASSGATGGQSQISGGRSATGGSGNTTGSTASGGRLTGGAGGTTSGGAPNGGAPSGGASEGGVAGGSASGGADSAGASGLGGQGSECPVIKCSAHCPVEYWAGPDGCKTCACAPPAPRLVAGPTSCPFSSLTISETSGYYVGGINRWLLDFEWQCSDMGLLGEPSHAHLQVGVLEPMSPPIDEKNRTFFYPTATGAKVEYEIRSATIWMRGSGVPEIEQVLKPSSSFLSVRIENGHLVGGVDFVGSDSTGSFIASMAGPFSGAVPTEP